PAQVRRREAARLQRLGRPRAADRRTAGRQGCVIAFRHIGAENKTAWRRVVRPRRAECMSPPPSGRITHLAEGKRSPHVPQLFPAALKPLKRSPIWRQQQKANAKLRESLPPPQYTPEQLKTPQLPADRLVDAIAAKARAEMSREWEPEQAPEQAIDRQAE